MTGRRAQRRGNRQVAYGPIVPAARQEPDARSVTPREHTEAVQLDFVNPAGAG